MKSLKKIASFALPIAGAALGPAGLGISAGLGAALGGAAGGLVQGKGLKGALIGGATGYAGNAIGDSLASTFSSGLGSAGSQTLGSALGKTSSNAIGNELLNTTFASGLGKFAGNQIAGDLASAFSAPKDINQENAGGGLAPEPTQPEPFSPKQDPQLSLPGSLTNLGGLDPMQQESSLATQGVYGGGLGPEEEKYFKNLINRKLVDQSGQVAPDLSGISSIDNSYLSQLGFSGYNNPTSLLEQLSKYGQQATA